MYAGAKVGVKTRLQASLRQPSVHTDTLLPCFVSRPPSSSCCNCVCIPGSKQTSWVCPVAPFVPLC
jgi:hypothetical protein